jgi:hypothetical protein
MDLTCSAVCQPISSGFRASAEPRFPSEPPADDHIGPLVRDSGSNHRPSLRSPTCEGPRPGQTPHVSTGAFGLRGDYHHNPAFVKKELAVVGVIFLSLRRLRRWPNGPETAAHPGWAPPGQRRGFWAPTGCRAGGHAPGLGREWRGSGGRFRLRLPALWPARRMPRLRPVLEVAPR